MEFDVGWILLGLPLAFGLGWLASRVDLRQLRLENRRSPKAYFRGLNHLLNEQQDQAIDAFIEAVQNDPDTSELHFALGNLFRRRGDYERAVRVHEHLLARGDLSQADRDRAQHALALDFLKAGLLDRAEAALRRLEGTAFETQSRLALLAIHERARDWPQAAQVARALERAGEGSFAGRLAHYLCEQAAGADDAQAEALLREADALPALSARPALALAAIWARTDRADAALDRLLALVQAQPPALALAAPALASLARRTGRVETVRTLLAEHQSRQPALDVLDALLALATDSAEARQWIEQHLTREPSLVAASRWLALQPAPADSDPQALLRRALDQAARPLLRWRCAACGFEAQQHAWQCPACQSWDSFPPRRVEEL